MRIAHRHPCVDRCAENRAIAALSRQVRIAMPIHRVGRASIVRPSRVGGIVGARKKSRKVVDTKKMRG